MSLKIGDKISLTIHDIAFGGEGVGRIDDFVVFVPFVLVGEIVEAEITEVKKSFARAKLLRVEKASPERVEPECRYFGACGGCQYQHIDYAAQLKIKHKQIADLFERVGKIPSDKIAPVIPCPQPYGYRNRIMIRSQWNGREKKLEVGFIRADSNFVQDIEECKISEPALNEQIKNVRANPPPKGGIKVVLRVQPEDWEVPQDSFFQNNFFLLPKLVETVRDFLKAGGAKHLIDLYCGVGFFGIEMANVVESFVGVEYDQRAIQAAQKNMAARNISNGEFISAKAEEVLPELLKKNSPEKTAVILDPPRKGCWPKTLNLLRETKPSQIIYVSCHPATMARDLNILCADGVFELMRVQPLDMFPQTQHVECVADLRAGQNLAKPREIIST
ncbi:MAG TPA: class I SAM-dependent RNA methyltransferase [Methylomirabilota bacterium]|nr:class I SAM-dependent RNA methyltransferase [Methylomirabilota bacterium]